MSKYITLAGVEVYSGDEEPKGFDEIYLNTDSISYLGFVVVDDMESNTLIQVSLHLKCGKVIVNIQDSGCLNDLVNELCDK